MQLVFSWAPKLARKCESKHWFPCGADGRSVYGGHVETQTMQPADCRLSVIFFYLYLNFLVKFLLQFPEGASTMEEGKLFLSVTVLYCHDYLNFLVEEAFSG